MGYRITAQREKSEPITIRSATADLKFIVFEPIRRVRIQLTEKEKQDSWNKAREWKHERRLSGELVLRIESNCGGGIKSEWQDKPESPFEDQIDELMTRLVTAMVLVEDLERQRREEQTRRWKLEQERAELERLRQVESSRWRHLLDFVAAARQAADARGFLDRIERRTHSDPVDPGLSEKYAEWIGWARSKADQIDPLVRPLSELQLEPEASRTSTLWR